MSTDIGRPQLHPAMRELIARRRAEELATQSWTPGCVCGARASREYGPDEARAWFERHKEVCASERAAA